MNLNKVHFDYFFQKKRSTAKKRCIWKFGWASPRSWLERGRDREIGGEREMVITAVVRPVCTCRKRGEGKGRKEACPDCRRSTVNTKRLERKKKAQLTYTRTLGRSK